MKAVMMSIKPKWCEKIASGEKTIEVRKNRPRLETPFKVYIYCTTDRGKSFLTKSHCTNELYTTKKRWLAALEKRGNVTYSGKVIGEFVCDRIIEWREEEKPPVPLSNTCLSYSEIRQYGLYNEILYLWHITDLVIYDEPKELNEFSKECPSDNCWECPHSISSDPRYFYEETKIVGCRNNVKRPPQSWCYVEVSNEV